MMIPRKHLVFLLTGQVSEALIIDMSAPPHITYLFKEQNIGLLNLTVLCGLSKLMFWASALILTWDCAMF